MSELPCIYGLYDREGKLRYIGKAKCAKTRFAGHLAASNRKRKPLYAWIREHGRPEMRILEADCQDWEEAEKRLIREARERGEALFNIAEGGGTPHMSREKRQENGRRSAKIRNPVVCSLLRRLGQDARSFIAMGNERLAAKLKHCQDLLRSMGKSERDKFAIEWERRRAIAGHFYGAPDRG